MLTTPTKEALTRGQRVARIFVNDDLSASTESRLAAEIDKAIAEETGRLREALKSIRDKTSSWKHNQEIAKQALSEGI